MVGAKRITPVINLGGTAGIIPPVPYRGREVFICEMSVGVRSLRGAPRGARLRRFQRRETLDSCADYLEVVC